MYKPLNKSFYMQDGLTVAKDLLGKVLIRKINNKSIMCKIVETEAYMGPEDKASHAYKNKRTQRTETMFKEGGCSYVYLIYGMYSCLNIVVNKKDIPQAVLIRAVEPLNHLDTIKTFRNIRSKKVYDLTNGPGKLCKALNIDKTFDGYDLVNGKDLFIIDWSIPQKIKESKRINIDYAEEYKDKLWRFYIEENKYISKK